MQPSIQTLIKVSALKQTSDNTKSEFIMWKLQLQGDFIFVRFINNQICSSSSTLHILTSHGIFFFKKDSASLQYRCLMSQTWICQCDYIIHTIGLLLSRVSLLSGILLLRWVTLLLWWTLLIGLLLLTILCVSYRKKDHAIKNFIKAIC